MAYGGTSECVADLEKNGHLVRIREEVDPNLEMAEIHRRVFEAEGPAILFERVKGSPFPAVSNLFGTLERSRFIFRDTLPGVKRLVELAADPAAFFKSPLRYSKVPLTIPHVLPRKVSTGPVFYGKTTLGSLPQVKCWPDDGGAFVLLPQVYSEDPDKPGVMSSNMGMYRVQISGNNYSPNREAGLHYQIRRDIGIHHSKALARREPFKVSVFIGGPPAHTFAAVMPLPSGMPEAVFAGGLAGRRFRHARRNGFTIAAEADFCITGTVVPGETRTEGPFGDHLGYYSLRHEFPFLKVESVYHRKDAIYPFTVVGRPPQEDTAFGNLIHEITGPMVPVSIPGVAALHAVDAAGVHPLLIAIGKERYVPYGKRKPMELITLASAILGFGHCSLAKYLFICAEEDNPALDIHDLPGYFTHILERADWTRDLHFQTATTIDTLDYSGTGLNEGSKVVVAVAGEKKRTLSTKVPRGLKLAPGFGDPAVGLPGVLLVRGPAYGNEVEEEKRLAEFTRVLEEAKEMSGIALVVVTDDSEFAARNLNNFLWSTFTRSNPSHDIHGVGSFMHHKHWGCTGPLVIDARLKPRHAPPLIEDPDVTKRVDALGITGGCLHGII